ncbi:MAG: glycosyltransferase family 2 protein [Planctomycetia bacterium]|nr:glycosyltransferase family 2 protein [Planctomycetia bacterium]
MTDELVSVIIPTYNRAYCVTRAIDSALAQTHRDVELLVIDDGSTDGTEELIRTRYGSDRRVRYLHQENAGVAEARNLGIRQMQGNFGAWLDSDDYWYPWKLEAQISAMRHLPDVGMIWTDMEAVDLEGRVTDPRYLRTIFSAYRWFTDDDLFRQRYPLGEFAPALGNLTDNATVFVGEIFSQMIAGNLVATSTALIRRDCMEKVGLMIRADGEDYEYSLRVCREGPVAFINLSSIQYQLGTAGNLSSRKVPIALSFVNVVTSFLERDRARIRLSDVMIRQILAAAHRWISEEALNSGDLALAREHVQASLTYEWRQPRAAAIWLASCVPLNVLNTLRRTYRSCKRLTRRR